MDKYDPEKKIGHDAAMNGARWYDVEPGTNPGFPYISRIP